MKILKNLFLFFIILLVTLLFSPSQVLATEPNFTVDDITVSSNYLPLNNVEATASVTFTDPGELDIHSAIWGWGDGFSSEGSISFSNGTGTITGSHIYGNSINNVHYMSLTVTDNNGSSIIKEFTYIIYPTIGGTSFNVTNICGKDVTWDPIDVTNISRLYSKFVHVSDETEFGFRFVLPITSTGGRLNFDPQFFSYDNAVLLLIDNEHHTIYRSQQINLSDPVYKCPSTAAPIINSISLSPNPLTINTTILATTSFSDADTLDQHTATIDWGDGSIPQSCSVIESNGSGSVSCTRASGYTSAGVYPVTITVSDGNFSATSSITYASVYAPTPQGLFSAGQKFVAPTGGNVTFGLSYKYQGTVPTGHRQFSMDYNQGNVHFNATSVNTLIISNGVGTLTGTGTYNGTTDYSFLVTGDENANTVRIQIKDPSGNVVYDTQPGDATTAAPTIQVTGNVIAH